MDPRTPTMPGRGLRSSFLIGWKLSLRYAITKTSERNSPRLSGTERSKQQHLNGEKMYSDVLPPRRSKEGRVNRAPLYTVRNRPQPQNTALPSQHPTDIFLIAAAAPFAVLTSALVIPSPCVATSLDVMPPLDRRKRGRSVIPATQATNAAPTRSPNTSPPAPSP